MLFQITQFFFLVSIWLLSKDEIGKLYSFKTNREFRCVGLIWYDESGGTEIWMQTKRSRALFLIFTFVTLRIG